MPYVTAWNKFVRMYKLPVHLTQFIGRQREIKETARLLSDPSCRLLTLVGPGGIGKTRLAVQTAAERLADQADGVVFVPLQSVQTGEFLIQAIADALDFPLSGPDEPLAQIGKFLAKKSLLLVLDNFEQLLAEAGVVTQLLSLAPQVKCLVTSRERLNLQGEWVYVLTGLLLPTSQETEAWQSCDAVALFTERARRVRWDFSLADEAESVITICRLTEGMPLALEMAAAWLKTLSCAEVAQEIRDNLDFLATALRNVPERHRSVRAVFTYSWQTLTPEAQMTFARLSVFQGGCRREAATAVTQATLPVLTSLVDKSLLRLEENGRYQIHELLRQFAAEKLAADPAALQQTQAQHAHYYNRFLGDRFAEITGGDQRTAVQEVAAELDNVRAAWQWAVSHRDGPALAEAVTTLHTFYQYQGRFREGSEALRTAVTTLQAVTPSPERDSALALLLTCAGWLEMRFGRIAEATEMVETAVALYDDLHQLPPPGAGTDPLTTLALLAVIGGDYGQSKVLGQQAWHRAAARSDQQNLAYAGYSLTSVALAEGDYEAALDLAQQTMTAAKSAGNRWFMTFIHYQLGKIMQVRGELAAARHCYQAGYAIRESFADPDGMAAALGLLAEIAVAEGDGRTAEQLYQQAITIYRENGNRGGLVQALQKLGMAVQQQGEGDRAYHYLWQALDAAQNSQLEQLTLAVLGDLGQILMARKEAAWGLAVLDFVAAHPLSVPADREQARRAVASYEGGERPFPIPSQSDLNTLLLLLRANLSAPQIEPVPLAVLAASPADQPLIEPLSERELEVLALIAAGLKNKEIADQLTVALSTIKTHINNIYGKLAVSSRVQAVTHARELNLID